MAKNVISDIVTKSKKAPLKGRAPEPANFSNTPKQKKETEARVSQKVSSIWGKPTNYPAFVMSQNENGSRIALWGLAAISVIFLFFALSTLFANATVTITPKSETFALNDALLKASKDSPESDLTFQTMTLTDSETKTINSTSTETVDKKASGRVVIYNAYSSLPQKLIVDTRLETADGKIYRIDNAVTVPGTSTKGGETLPGSVEVSVHADKGGAEYNIGLTDFTIPGFKGGLKYGKFYARSKTEITGAISGKVYVLEKNDLETAKTELGATLEDKLVKKAEGELPKGFVLFKDASNFEILNSDATFESENSAVPVTLQGKLTAVILDEAKLANKIASVSLKDWNGKEDIYIPNLRNISFSLKDDLAGISSAKEISFALSGQGKIIWKFDEEKLKSELLGKKKSGLKDVIRDYPSIARAEAKLSPPFRSTFPKDKKDIKLINTEALK